MVTYGQTKSSVRMQYDSVRFERKDEVLQTKDQLHDSRVFEYGHAPH